MAQTLSAWRYIKNNKRRVSVLVVSLSLCFVLFYLTNFLLTATTETFEVLLLANSLKVQYITLPPEAFGLDAGGPGEELEKQWEKSWEELAEQMRRQKGVSYVYVTKVWYTELSALVGQFSVEVPMLERDQIPVFMEHCGATLKEGRLPERENEILLDERLMKNGGYQIGDHLKWYDNTEIVGVAGSDQYFGCGIGEEEFQGDTMLCVLSDGSIRDMAALLYDMGYEFNENHASIVDYKKGLQELQHDVKDGVEPSSDLIFGGIIGILSLSLLVVYITYLRDRRNEWCLYCSIGFSRQTIYFSVMRELLFTFGIAVLAAGGLLAVLVPLLDHTIIRSLGLYCEYLDVEVIGAILCAYVWILGMLQIPIRYALYKIQTIDAMDDDLR